jgi:outer membrane protein
MYIRKAGLKKSCLGLSTLAILTASQFALAYEAGDIVIRGGVAAVNPNETSSIINIETLSLGNAGNAKVSLDTERQLGLTASYMVTNNLGLELLAASPFTHNILGDGTLNGVGKLGKTKHLPPTLNLNYYLNDEQSKFQPYVGLGINYTIFFDTSASPALDNTATINTLANLTGNVTDAITSASNTDIELDNSVGVAFQLGFDYQLTDCLSINAAYWKIDIDTVAKITTDTNLGQVTANVDLDIDPSVVMVGLAYKF